MIRGVKIATILLFISLILPSCWGRSGANQSQTESSSDVGTEGEASLENSHPIGYGYTVKRIFPHSEIAYTQGLFWHDGALWESTGGNGSSYLMNVDLKSGRAQREIALERRHFGEGSTILNNKIYFLTWTSGVAFVYDATTLEKIDEFNYPGEGWGITTDGQWLYMSDGSNKIYRLDPATFKREQTISVEIAGRRIKLLNELEWIEGRIWANVYMSDSIMIIDPENGAVEGVVNLSGILSPSDYTHDTDVLNGIAYDPESKRIFVTGKNWNKLFEIEIFERDGTR